MEQLNITMPEETKEALKKEYWKGKPQETQCKQIVGDIGKKKELVDKRSEIANKTKKLDSKIKNLKERIDKKEGELQTAKATLQQYEDMAYASFNEEEKENWQDRENGSEVSDSDTVTNSDTEEVSDRAISTPARGVVRKLTSPESGGQKYKKQNNETK